MATHILPFSVLLSTLLLLHFRFSVTQAQVPLNQTFKIVNDGWFGDYNTEYGAGYRPIESEAHKNFFAFPSRLCFYNTTPGEFIFGMRAGLPRDESQMRWVWDANRNRPVKENATLSFGVDGNLVLADHDGTVVWQTNTANKGVVGIKMLNVGNLVLFDKNGKFVWQSFDHPVDTLLNGMMVSRMNGPHRLVARTSDADGRDGKYSLVVEPDGFKFYMNNSGQLVDYNGWTGYRETPLVAMKFKSEPIGQDPNSAAWELLLEPFQEATPPPPPKRRLLQSYPTTAGNALILHKLNYNTSISFFRLGSDGNVKVFTYFDNAPYLKWSETFAYFSDYYVRECGRPEKCGSLGLCSSGMCVACPTQKGLLGWSETCAPPKLKPCAARAKVDYYKIEAAEHFLNRDSSNGEGPTSVEACKSKCSNDCRCKGFVYKQDIKKCLRFPVVGTFIKDTNTSTAYIKYSI